MLARKRSRGVEATARAEALERLKALRRGGRRSENGEGGGGYSIKLETPIYDTVPEEEYNNLVARRRKEAQGFIVDDDGLGYGDEGQEEDWSRAGLPPSSDESDGEDGNKNRSRRKKPEKKEKEKDVKKVNASLTAAAAMMGKTKISAMFTSNVFKNRDSGSKVKSFDCENIIDDVIAEFAPDEGDRERRRRGQLGLKNSKPIKSESQVFYDCNNNVNFMDKAQSDRNIGSYGDSKGDGGEKDEEKVDVREGKLGEENLCNSVKEDVGSVVEVKKNEVVVKEESGSILNAKISEEERDPALSAAAGWKEVRSGGGGGVMEEVESGASVEQSEFEVDRDGSLPFYIIDAHEEIFGANIGTIYLFGKVMCNKLIYMSILFQELLNRM